MIRTAGFRALRLRVSLSLRERVSFVWGNLNSRSVLQASFLECVCYMFRARMFYTIELELLLF